MRLLVCGGRDYDDRRYLFTMLDVMHEAYPITVVIEGEQRGADLLARAWAETRGVPFLPEEAEWTKYGKAAGRIRNKAMLDKHHPDLVLAFPGGRGTANMIEQAEKAGVKVVRAL